MGTLTLGDLPHATLWTVTRSTNKIALYNPCVDFFHHYKPSVEVEWDFHIEAPLGPCGDLASARADQSGPEAGGQVVRRPSV